MVEIKGIVFDMDGVLIDSESVYDVAWDLAGKDFNIPMTIAILNSCRGANKHDIVEILKQTFGSDFDADSYLERTAVYFNQIEEEKGIPLLPFAKESLEYLSKKYKIALASSAAKSTVEKHLQKTGIGNYFSYKMCGDMVFHSKPHPEIYQKSCELLGLPPSECVAIEDTPNGIKSASDAGMKVIMVPDRIQPTEKIIPLCWKICKTLDDLKSFL